jgi:formate dehydrogenase subunit gamma
VKEESPINNERYKRKKADRQAMAQDKIIRFSLIERLIHWGQAIPFLGLLITGLAMHWVSFAHLVFGSVKVARTIHKLSALCWLIIPTFLILLTSKDCLKAELREIFIWHKRDFIWLWTAIKRVFRKGGDLPPQGRFNAGQKINSFLTLAFFLMFSTTGLFIWTTQGKGWFLPTLIHNILFILVWPIFFGHLYLALLNRDTRESIKGMIWGEVDSQWVREHHCLWYQDLTNETHPGLVFYRKEGLGLNKLTSFVQKEGLYPDKRKKEIKHLLKHSTFIVVARNNGRIIGWGRAISDGISYGIITDTYIKQEFTSPEIEEKIKELLTDQLKPLGVPIFYLPSNNNHKPNNLNST